ncbi:uncharacterized protein LOC119987645 [Tripterygium wilfordii]|uniref:uncharacterized protein LOC119987645 n=1 Tax=Tripterygium wilfordii TaxID=458696 RepID=UPI0018F85872|nr:uncharacterized protein LOC119987645 [Tripterygium wilfordii]XP_038688489.1 uncharacterized protein LOC119987645 [Tripterygium wilfordii]
MTYPCSSSDLYREAEGVKYNEWDGFSITHDALIFNPNNTGLDLAESQKDFTWPNQELNQSYQTSQNQLNHQPLQGLAPTEAGTSHSVRRRGGKSPSVPHLSRNPGKTLTSNERKKEIDKRYREKCKESKKNMEWQLDQLGGENTNLHNENMNLMMEKESINNSLQSAEIETKDLKMEIRKLKTNMTNQQVFVDSFLKKFEDDVSNNENHQLEIKKLQNEIMILRQTNWDDWLMNKAQLVQDIGNLEHENKVLRIQVDALCEKIHNDLDTKPCTI